MLFAAAGYKVRLFDIEPKQVQSALKEIETQLNELEKTKLIRGSKSAKEQIALISGRLECFSATFKSSVTLWMQCYRTSRGNFCFRNFKSKGLCGRSFACSRVHSRNTRNKTQSFEGFRCCCTSTNYHFKLYFNSHALHLEQGSEE